MIQAIRNETAKDQLINSIIMMEWDMFRAVNNIGGQASCQRDDGTFYIMRYSQHSTMSEDTLRSWRDDLRQAETEGRNLMMEKYAYMMEFTDYAYYKEHVESVLPVLPQEKANIIADIISRQLLSFEDFQKTYPKLAGAGREKADDSFGTSIRTYSIGELKTYSMETLQLVLRDTINNPNYVYDIKRMTAELYGYSSIDAAEEAL